MARTIYLGSAPTATAANRGLEDRRIKLGCVLPGEAPAIFGDALRRLSTASTYLYHDGTRYWYSTQPTVTKMAEDRAEQLKRNPDKVNQEIDKRIRADLRKIGDFERVHALPQSSQDVPDDMDARLVVLATEHPHSRDTGNPAEAAAKAIFETRGSAPRLYRNALVFLAVDKTRLQDLDEAVRRYLAWKSILDEQEQLNLDPHQVKQAQARRGNHVAVKQLVDDFARYLYLPRLSGPSVLVGAIRDGLGLLTWEQDSFVYADDFDDAAGRYRGLRCGQLVGISADSPSGLLVRSEVAQKQLKAETTPEPRPTSIPTGPGPAPTPPGPAPTSPKVPKHFHGSVQLDPTRVGRDAGRIADEVIAHLAGLVGSTVTVTLDIDAEIPSGAPDHVVRTVTENSRTLKFTSQGFEEE